LGREGWLYFGSDRAGGIGKTDIWRARADERGRWQVENLGPSINSVGNEYEPLLSADESRMIVAADDGLYESRHAASGWSPRVRLPAAINANGTEIGALFSPSGKSMLFARDMKNALSGEFMVWHIEGREDWPVNCSQQ
jgi:hypothetical protein